MIRVNGEIMKLKRIKGIHMIYIFPLLLSFVTIYELSKAANLADRETMVSSFSNLYLQLYSVFAPFVIILLVYSLIQVENKNNMWESNIMLPVKKIDIYLSKIGVSILSVIVFCVTSYLFYVLAMLFCDVLFPSKINFGLADNNLLLIFFSKMLLVFTLYAVIAIPLFIFVDSSVISIGFFAFFLLLSLFFTQKSWYEFYPFSYQIIAQRDFNSAKNLFNDSVAGIVSIYIVISLLLGMAIYQRNK